MHLLPQGYAHCLRIKSILNQLTQDFGTACQTVNISEHVTIIMMLLLQSLLLLSSLLLLFDVKHAVT